MHVVVFAGFLNFEMVLCKEIQIIKAEGFIVEIR